MTNREIAALFNRIADLLDIKGVAWKPQAYRKVARVIEQLDEPLDNLYVKKGKKGLLALEGVGERMASHLVEYLTTGRVAKFDRLQQDLPGSVAQLLRIEGLGPKTVALLQKKLGITSVEGLKRALASGKLAKLEGFREKTLENLRSSIALFEHSKGRMRINQAAAIADELTTYLSQTAQPSELCVVGSLRRMKETIGDIDVLATGNASQIMDAFVGFPGVQRVLAKGSTKSSIITRNGVQVDVRVVSCKSFGAALVYFTGSKQHNIDLRSLAIGKGWTLSEYGLFRKGSKRRIGGKTEKEMYSKLGLSYIPPELRESRGEIARAQQNNLPKLVELKDIRGDLHTHSRYSDGSERIETMAHAASKKGYAYMAVTDHSRSQRIANGISAATLKKQGREIDRLQKKLSIKLLKGAEVDILKDGSLDYPDAVLQQLDWVIASIHSGFKMPEQAMTHRLEKALSNPHITAWGHPTGRKLGKRKGYTFDVDAVLETAKKNRVVLEINSDPQRLDAYDDLIFKAKKKGLLFCINTDSHRIDSLDNIRFGVGMARRGWLEKKDVVNTKPWKAFRAFLNKRN